MATSLTSDAERRPRPGTAPDNGRHRPASDDARRRRAYAALDLGTNNCRLLIARPSRDGFYVVDAFSRIVRLGEGLLQTGRISDEAQDRACEALSVCAGKLTRRGVTLARSVATEACRRAENGGEFIARVYERTGIALDVISAAEEARLAVLGCQSLIETDAPRALVFDIGGGSTEIVVVDLSGGGEDVSIDDWISVPWGVVSLAETEPEPHGEGAARLDVYERMKARVAAHLAPFKARTAALTAGGLQLLGTSGTITTLASVHLGLAAYDRRLVDGCWVPQEAMRTVSAMLACRSPADRAEVACIGSERAELVVAGCAILEAILDAWPAEKVRVADRGIREGILRTLMARDGHRFA